MFWVWSLLNVVTALLSGYLSWTLIRRYGCCKLVVDKVRSVARGTVVHNFASLDRLVDGIRCTQLRKAHVHEDNQHGDAAASRSSAVAHQRTVCDSLSLSPYDVSASRTSVRRGVPGERLLHDLKDLANHTEVVHPDRSRIGSGTMVWLNDVADHMSLREISELFNTDAVTSSYDFQLNSPACKSFGASIHYNGSEWEFVGADTTYTQQVWHYGKEAIATTFTKFHFLQYVLFVCFISLIAFACWCVADELYIWIPFWGKLCYEYHSFHYPWFALIEVTVPWLRGPVDWTLPVLSIATLRYPWPTPCMTVAPVYFTIVVCACLCAPLFISSHVTVRKIVRVGMPENRVINYTIPVSRMSTVWYYLFWRGRLSDGSDSGYALLGESKLTRLEPTKVVTENNTYYVMSSVNKSGVTEHHGCVAGTSTARTITDSDLSIARVRLSNKTTSPGGCVILAHEEANSSCKSNVCFDMFLEICRASNTNIFASNSIFVFKPRPMTSYTVGPTATSVTSKTPLGPEQFMETCVPEMLYPEENPSNLAHGHSVRVAQQRATSLDIKPHYWTYAREFLEQLYPSKLALSSEDEVYERQTRPNQRAILEEAAPVYGFGFNPFGFAKEISLRCFGKKEPVAGINQRTGGELKAKRIITTFEGPTKFLHSRVTIPMANAIKGEHWYVFSQPLDNVAAKVAALCVKARKTQGETRVINTDLSKMDGTVNDFWRKFDDLRDLQAWPKDIADKIIESRHTTFNRKVKLPGVPIIQGQTELGSGHPDTSLGQSTRATFIEYCAWRELGKSHQDAYALLGLHGGDDGLSHYIDPDFYKTIALNMGMILKVEVAVLGGTTPVSFLGRIYAPSVFYGECDSMCDPVRALSQFPYSTSTCTTEVKARSKAFSIAQNDANTPFVGGLAKRILNDLGAEGLDEGSMSWNAAQVINGSAGYPNTFGDWMLEHCQRLGLHPSAAWDEYVEGKGEWSTPPVVLEAEPVVATENALVGDVVHNIETPPPEQVSSPPDVVVEVPKKTIPVCHDWSNGKCDRKNCSFAHARKEGSSSLNRKSTRARPASKVVAGKS